MEDPGLGYQFTVKIDGAPLGDWTKCDGLSMEFHVTEYEEGGMNSFIHRIPGRAKYGNIKLTRPLNSKSQAVSAWMTSLMATVKRQTAEITVMDPSGEQVASWNLVGVYPVKWSGPTLDADGKMIATETLEIAHNGFVGDLGGAGGSAAAAMSAGGLL
jgi:phage tail-like protein